MDNLTWFKYAGLDAVQSAANVILTLGGGDAMNLWSMDFNMLLGAGAGAAIVSLLRAVVAYQMPNPQSVIVSQAYGPPVVSTGRHSVE